MPPPPRGRGGPGWANQPPRRPAPPPVGPPRRGPLPPPAPRPGAGPLRQPPPGRGAGGRVPQAPVGGYTRQAPPRAPGGPPVHPASQAPRDGRVTRMPEFRRPNLRMLRGRGKAILIVLLVAIIGFGVYLDANLTRVEALADTENSSDGTNYLIVGSDSREGLSAEDEERLATGDAAGQRTDTIMLLHSGSSGDVLVSIPRDSYVPIPGKGSNKINAAYALGGPQLLVQTVQDATGLRIDHYVEVGFGGFVGAVDAVGGVDMCVPQSITDPKAGLDIKEGCQELDGQTALGYVRTRATAGSDFDRVKRQREFLSALLSKATSPLTIINPFRIIPLANAMTGTITVDDSDHVWNLAGLAWAMKGVSGGDGVQTTVPVAGGGAGSTLRWDRTRSKNLFDALAKDQAPAPGDYGP